LASWDFRTRGGQASVATTTAMTGVSATAPSLVASLATGLSAVNYLGNGLTGSNQTATSLAAALTGNDYISFTVAPASGRSVSVSAVKIRPVSQNRLRSFVLMSSVRGFTAGNEISTFTASGNDGAPLTTVNITGHSNLTGAVEFRLYVYGYTDPYEAAGIGNRAATLAEADLVVEGSVATSTVAVTGVSVSPTSASLAVGGTQQLTATVSPANATNQTVSWSSSNTSVATVNASGLVTAVAAGSATITATTQDGSRTATSAITVTGSTVLRNPENPTSTASGLDYQYYEGTGWSAVADLNALTPIKSGTAANFDLGVRNRDDNFGVSFTGFVNVPTDGTYTFYTSSDDGSKLFIGTTEVVNNDGLHAAQERSGTIGLKAGRHAIRVAFFEATGGEVLSVSYAGPGLTKQAIPATALSRATAQPYVVRELWSNVTGTGVAAIPVTTTPTSTSQLTSLEGPTNVADNYGARIRGYITPAASGSYTFYLASDDNAQLFLSTSDNPANKAKIAEVTDWTNSREWTKQPTQTSTARSLTAGTRYYVEVLHKEGNGGDNLAVGWTGPGISTITVIGGNVLSPFEGGNPTTYALTVNSGTGSGSYAQGTVVNISANAAPAGKVFDAWTGNVAAVASVTAATTTLTMPAAAVSVTATYKDQPSGVSLSVNKNTKHQTIDGFGFFGARDVWWGSSNAAHFYSDAWLDRIVSDLGVSIWRNELYPHNPPTGNTTPNQDAHWDKQRPMVQALKAKADQYGVDLKMILTVWSPPGEFKWWSQMAWAGDENALRGPGGDGDYWPERAGGTLNPNRYNQFATWLSQGLQMYKNAGVNVYAISPQNEPAFAQTFNSNTYTTGWYNDMLKAVIPQVKAQHPGVRVYGSEHMLDNEGADNNYPYFYHNKLKSDPAAMSQVDILAVHGYLDGVAASSGSVLADYWTNHKEQFTQPANKKAWMTETSGYVDAWEGENNKPGAFGLANDMHTALYYGDLSAWVYWQGSGLGGINEYNLMSDLVVGKKYYASKNFYRFIRPGAVRLATTSPDPAVVLTAYEHVANGTHTIVLINNATTAKTINLAMTGSGLPASFEMFVTSASRNCESLGTVAAGSITLPARSVVTLQAGGTPLAGSNAARTTTAPEGADATQTAKLAGVTIYPNPTNGIVYVATGEAKEVKATISTIHGARLNLKAKQPGAGTLSFDISGQPAGIYLLRVEADGKGATYRVFKQ
jgi:O-glycosyl hydrolase